MTGGDNGNNDACAWEFCMNAEVITTSELDGAILNDDLLPKTLMRMEICEQKKNECK